MGDYIKEIRELIGTRPFILTGSAVLIFNRKNELLLQLRSDTGKWGIPGGAMELGESFIETAKREIFEETGLLLRNLKFLDVLSGKDYYFQYPNGDEIFNAIALYSSNEWEGTLEISDGESKELRFFPLDQLPPLEGRPAMILGDLARYQLIPEVKRVDLQTVMTVAEILELQRTSYKAEAELIGTEEIPPLKETFEQLQNCEETFIGCFFEGRIAGALSYKVINEVLDIHRMMVHPDFFQRGFATKLLNEVERIEPGVKEITVSTGAANTPAIRLYEKQGFIRGENRSVGNNLLIATFNKSL